MHDSGLERAHVADVADELGVPFGAIGAGRPGPAGRATRPRPRAGATRWTCGAPAPQAREQLAGSLATLADDPAVAAVALAVDLVHEFDGDQSYPQAVLDAARLTSKPVAVLSNLPSAIDPDVAAAAARGRASRCSRAPAPACSPCATCSTTAPLDHGRPAARGGPPVTPAPADSARRDRWAPRCWPRARPTAPRCSGLLRDYGIAAARAAGAVSADGALAAAGAIGYPVVLKTDEPGIAHKSDAGGVVLGVRDPAELAAAYQDLAERLGPRVLVVRDDPAGTELALGLARDPELGPLLVVGAGGVLVELLADRAVALPPVGRTRPGQMVGELRVAALLAGVRGQPAADLDAVVAAITGLSQLAGELGGALEAPGHQPADLRPGRRGGRGRPGHPAPGQPPARGLTPLDLG